MSTVFAADTVVALGTDFTLTTTLYADAAATTPLDLTGATSVDWSQHTDRPHEPTQRELFKKGLSTGVTVVGDPTLGQISVAIDPADQAGITEQGRYYYAVDVLDGGGEAARPEVGFLDYRA